jgi:hypothetical protein
MGYSFDRDTVSRICDSKVIFIRALKKMPYWRFEEWGEQRLVALVSNNLEVAVHVSRTICSCSLTYSKSRDVFRYCESGTVILDRTRALHRRFSVGEAWRGVRLAAITPLKVVSSAPG